MSVNKVILIGNVGTDPNMRYPEPGKPIASFKLATNERVPDSQMEITEWHNIVLFGRYAEIAERYVRKGTRLYIEGRLRTRSWDDRVGIKHTITEIYADHVEMLGRGGS